MQERRQVPGPRGLSFVRYATLLARDPIAGLVRCRAEFGDIFGFTLPRRVVMLASPEAARHVLLEERSSYGKGASFAELRALIGEGLLTADGDAWLAQRRAMSPDFSLHAMAPFRDQLGEEAERWIDGLRKRAVAGDTLDVYTEVHRFMLRLVARTLFGSVMGQDIDALLAAFTAAVELVTQRTVAIDSLPLSVPTPANVRFNRAVRSIDKALATLLEGNADGREASFRRRLEALAAEFPPHWLRDQILTFLIAGSDTTATMLCWTLQLLALHPEAAAQARADAQVLNAVLLESVRLYPPVPLIARDALVDGELAGYPIARGTPVFAMTWLIHRHPEWWREPDAFLPQRFLEEKLWRSPAFLPFGTGPRKCIGENLALMQARIVIGQLLQAFELAPADADRFVPELSLVLRPRGVLRLRLQPLVRGGPVETRCRDHDDRA